MINHYLENEYFEWMYDRVCGGRYAKSISYRKLLMYLHSKEFIFTIPKDKNRATDGIDLRRRFIFEKGYNQTDELDGPCSVLEMMVGLAIRCEESIMDDPTVGDRTGQWFWGMMVNLGLGAMTDDRFDKQYVEECVIRFLNREYEANGRGGLFTVRHYNQDLRKVEIWWQMIWYLDEILDV